MYLLDTHTLLWLLHGNPILSTATRAVIDQARNENSAAVSAISFWEIARLDVRKRISLGCSIMAWREKVLFLGIKELELTSIIAIEAACLQSFHADPADRFIVATALYHQATLITADREILKWEKSLQRLDARA